MSKGERTISEVVNSLDIDASLLSKWIRASSDEGADAFRGQGKRSGVEEEIWQLKVKNKQLEQEPEFLKKVSRYNTNWRHSTLGYISPAEFERRNAA